MMKKLFLVLALAAVMLPVMAQDIPSYKEKSFKFWDEAPLAEDDFSDRHLAATVNDVAGELFWGIAFSSVTDRIGNLRYTHPVTRVYMDRLQSWKDPDRWQPWSLSYFQTEFDLLESFRRKMQRELIDNPLDYSEIRDYYTRAVHSAVDAYHLESDLGRDAGVVAQYEVQYKEELDSLEAEVPVKEPQFRKSLVGEGVYAGYLCEVFGSPLSTAIGLSQGFNLGLSFPIGDVYLAMDMTMGPSGRLKQDGFYYDNRKDYAWRKGEKCTSGHMNLLAGYTVLDRPVLALRPIAGVGVSFLDQDTGLKNGNGSYESSEINGLRLTAGVQLACKLRRSLAVSGYGGGGYGETSLVFKAYAAHTDYKGIGEIWSANLGVALDWSGWFLRRNKLIVP